MNLFYYQNKKIKKYENRKHGVFLIIFTCFLKVGLKPYIIIKNKTLNIKNIFKIYLKILKTSLKYFKFPNRFLFY